MRRLIATGALLLMTAGRGVAQDTIRIKAGAPAWGDHVGLKRLYQIGGPPGYDLGTLYSTTVDRMGRVYSFDLHAGVLKHYSADGKLLGIIGRNGSGPGEYRELIGIAIIHDSLVVGFDQGNARLTVYYPDGRFEHQAVLSRTLTGWSGQLVSDTGNAVYLRSSYIIGPDRKVVRLAPNQVQWLRVNEQGAPVDSIVEPHFEDSPEPVFRIVGLNDNFVVEGESMPSPVGGLVFGKGDTYRFGIMPMHGPVTIVEKPWKPIPLTSEEYSQWRSRLDWEHDHDPKRPNYSLPRTKPAYRWLNVDEDARIWVELFAPATKRDLPPRDVPNPSPRIYWFQDHVYDVFDPHGKYLARVTLPWNEDWFKARGDKMWSRGHGPDGEETMIAYQFTGIKGH